MQYNITPQAPMKPYSFMVGLWYEKNGLAATSTDCSKNPRYNVNNIALLVDATRKSQTKKFFGSLASEKQMPKEKITRRLSVNSGSMTPITHVVVSQSVMIVENIACFLARFSTEPLCELRNQIATRQCKIICRAATNAAIIIMRVESSLARDDDADNDPHKTATQVNRLIDSKYKSVVSNLVE
mmetsp:Transcript_7447/g.11345  ORF Transcript_7447/g.11345 Transcript_7447/m.11345 type:complete len:184 (-) Transcript_7447:585-1136(-)